MRGKPITTDPAKIAEEEYLDNLYKAIALIQQFAEGFSTLTPEDLRQGGISALKHYSTESGEVSKLAAEELFARQYNKAKMNNPAVSRFEVAQEEEARTSILIEELEAISGVKHYYKTDPRYKKIVNCKTGYLTFLNDILSQKQPEGSSGINFEKLPSVYSEEQMRKIFDKCTYLGLTKKRDKENFVSKFSYPEEVHQKSPQGPSKRVFWDGEKRDNKVALYGIIHRITGQVLTAARLRIYFDTKYTINDNQYGKDKETGEYPRPKLCDQIFAGF